MKDFLHMLWVPLAYLLAPKWLGRKALHGTLVQMGYGGGLIPKAAMYEIADRAFAVHKASSRNLSLRLKMEGLYTTMLVNAEQIIAVIFEENRHSTFLASCHFHHDILNRHGVDTAPILVDKNGRQM